MTGRHHRAAAAWHVHLLLAAACTAGACRPAPAQDARSPAGAAHVPTYTRDVAPILLSHCATCHRPVDAAGAGAGRLAGRSDPLCVAGAPFPLLSYEDARRQASAIAAAVSRRAMPPWLPEPGHGDFVNERRLTEAQIETLQRWVAAGAPEGDPAARPSLPAWPDGWQLGTPHLAVRPEPFTLGPEREDVFRNFVIPVPGSGVRYVRAIEFRAENPSVIHHANLAVDPSRVARRLDRAEPGPGFSVMPDDQVQNVYGWSPGKVPVMEPADTAWVLEEGADLVLQLHLVSSGTSEVVQPTIGLFFSTTPPTRVPIVVKLESKTIDIPAGDPNHVLEDSYVLPADVDLVSVYPHAHYLAREVRGTATLPDGTMRSLLYIRQWDIRWQDQYRYRAPVFLPKGSTLRMRVTYDNSEANPNNRFRPPRRVAWGPRSTDEMGALWMEVVPRQPGDAQVLADDYFRRALAADVAAAEMMVSRAPDDPAARNLLATRYIRAGRLADAQAHLERALHLSPDNAEARTNLGTVYQMQGRIEEALRQMQRAAALKPRDDHIRFNLGNALLALGRVRDAERELRDSVRLNPENADARFNLAMILGPQNRLEEAIAHLQAVVEINPRNADAYRNLALAFELQGRVDEALVHLRRSLRIDPSSAAARQQLARLTARR